MNRLETLSQVMEMLKTERGYDEDFNLLDDHLELKEANELFPMMNSWWMRFSVLKESQIRQTCRCSTPLPPPQEEKAFWSMLMEPTADRSLMRC